MLDKILAAIVVVLLLGMVALGVAYHEQGKKALLYKQSSEQYKDAYTRTMKTLQVTTQSNNVTSQVNGEVASNKADMVTQAVNIKDKVDTIATKVEKHEITDDAADAAYIDSMWDAYCQAVRTPINSHCSGRQSTPRLPY